MLDVERWTFAALLIVPNPSSFTRRAVALREGGSFPYALFRRSI